MLNYAPAAQPSRDTFWASAPREEIAAECLQKITDYYSFLQMSGLKARWIDTYRYYYRGAVTQGQLIPSGEQGELTEITVNHFRNILQHLTAVITQQDLAFECRAVNSDRKSLSQTIIGNGLLNYYLQHGPLKDVRHTAVELAVLHGDAFVELLWDPNSGEVVGVDMPPPDPMQPDADPMAQATEIREGDPELRALSPLDVVRDYTAPNSDAKWYIVRDFVSRWDLAAKYAGLLPDGSYKDQELAEKIYRHSVSWGSAENFRLGYMIANDKTDLVPIWRLLHDRTPAMPQGRLVEFLSNDCVLTDSPFPYQDMSVYRVTVADQLGSGFGYSIAEDLKPVQKAMDGCDSTVLSNLVNFGVANLLAKKGSGVTLAQLNGSSNLVEYDGDKDSRPEFMQPVPVPPMASEFRAQLKGDQEQLAAISSLMRGEPPPNVKSGAFGALLANQTLQFASNLQRSDAQLMQHLGIGLLRMFRRFATTPRVAMIAGKASKSMMTQFTGDDLSEIDRVEVDLGSPLLRTTAGRAQIAEDLMSKGMVKDGQQYLLFLQTGKLDPIYEHETSRLLLMKAENERLQDGQQVQALISDPHPEHIKEHLSVLDSPELRDPKPENTAVIQFVLDHVLEHKELWTQMDPVMLAAVGIPPPPLPMVLALPNPMVPPGGPGNPVPGQPPPQGPPPVVGAPPPPPGPGGPPPPHGGPPGHPGPLPPSAGMPAPGNVAGGPKQPNLPNLPVDPLTGQR